MWTGLHSKEVHLSEEREIGGLDQLDLKYRWQIWCRKEVKELMNNTGTMSDEKKVLGRGVTDSRV